jgi:CubicO group peptidase (beta-lactamase class C family)
MKGIIFVFLIGIGFTCVAQQKESVKNTPASIDSAVLKSIEKTAGILLTEVKANSVSVGVVKDGKIYSRHYGEIDKGKGNKATDKTMFELASVTKVFTGNTYGEGCFGG